MYISHFLIDPNSSIINVQTNNYIYWEGKVLKKVKVGTVTDRQRLEIFLTYDLYDLVNLKNFPYIFKFIKCLSLNMFEWK